MKKKRFLSSYLLKTINLILILGILFPVGVFGGYERVSARQAVTEMEESTGIFRSRILFSQQTDRAQLDELKIRVLREGEGWALILATGDQLESLARLGLTPQATVELATLVSSNEGTAAWLEKSLQTTMSQTSSLWIQAEKVRSSEGWISAQETQVLFEDMHALVNGLSDVEASGIANLISPDDDADGLTNTQESWWCTDPLNADTDGDGTSDGEEIQALKAWVRNERESAPGETPWPDWPFDPDTCPDKDHDSIPNLAERWELGLHMDRESTDFDKFDDGQEVFGVTYCPGGDLSCGYGDLPRSSDSGYVGSNMPAWVEPPGNHSLVAAFPIPEIDMVESSLRVETVTVVTTNHTIGEGTERSYSTAKTEGTSNSVADTVTWNEWQEFSKTTKLGDQTTSRETSITASPPPKVGNAEFIFDAAIDFGSCLFGGNDLWGTIGCIKTIKDYSWVISQMNIFNPPKVYAPTTEEIPNEGPQCTVASSDSGGSYCDAEGYHYALNSEMVEAHKTSHVNGERPGGGSGYSIEVSDYDGKVTEQRFQELYYPIKKFVPTQTITSGHSQGGEQTTTTTEYEEHTITNGEAFSDTESWGTATAVDSSHAADLWFTYQVSNTGMEYAREICDLAFNIYIGDDPNPVYTYFVANDIGGDGCFNNFMPGESHEYSSKTKNHAIPLTLEQMKAIDLGSSIRIVVEDYTYGDDELFYEDAVNAGVQIAIEDGTSDGDESIDNYLIPTWGTETVLDVLARYFPHETDADGTLISIWTPEYRRDTPSWCNEPERTGDTLWCKHALSTADWWNVYTNGLGDGTQGFQDTPAAPGAVALFRFNKDSDLDGYSDRTEGRLGTDAHDASDHPQPELLAGMHSLRDGDHVTATLSLLNTGIYDAYGVEAVMIAPDDTITITNNTVGGSGRVGALDQVVVGSRIVLEFPLPSAWTHADHAQPVVGGYYTGGEDRTYTFTVNCGTPGGCTVGSGTWTLDWNDDTGNSGSLSFGSGYNSPTRQEAGSFDAKVGLISGQVADGESFTVDAHTPRDTFQYDILTEPYTPPLVVVSYNDPQGNHRFQLSPEAMALTSPEDNLSSFAGGMLADPGVEIVTTESFSTGQNTTNLTVNNPSASTLADAHLFLEFIDPNGTVVSEVDVTQALPPGPSVVLVAWNTNDFSPAYDSGQDYIVLAFWTDHEGNILDTAGRPLSSFQDDPSPVSKIDSDELLWDFGEARQGTLMQRKFVLGNTGFADLLTYLEDAQGITVTGPASEPFAPADMGVYTMTINTADLAVGSFQRALPIRTSDPENPTRTITIQGEILPFTPSGDQEITLRPLDWEASVSGDHTQGEWVEFAHNLGPDPQTLHPVNVYDQDYSTLWGVGKYATDFGQGTSSYDMFGDGSDGAMPTSGNLDYDQGFGAGTVNGTAGSTSISVVDRRGVSRIDPGDVVLIHQTQGSGAGNWELNKAVSNFTGNGTFALEEPLEHNYLTNSSNKAQILRVPQYSTCNVTGTVTPLAAWNGTWGGLFAVMCNDKAAISGAINGEGKGFRGGDTNMDSKKGGEPGEGVAGISGWGEYSAGESTNPAGGGLGHRDGDCSDGGNSQFGYTGGGGGGATESVEDESAGGGGGGGMYYGGGGGGSGTDGDGNHPTGSPSGGYSNALGGGDGGDASGDGTNGYDAGSRSDGYCGIGGDGQGGAGKSGGGGGGGANHADLTSSLTNVVFGGGGGNGGGVLGSQNGGGGSGGDGGGLVFVFAKEIEVTGIIKADGANGSTLHSWAGGGGGGAAGAILLKGEMITLGSDKVTATGGSPGNPVYGGEGGYGSRGAIRIEYCESLVGSTNPTASTQKLDCYITEQVESSPYTTTRLNLPESFTSGNTYQVQYGRRYEFGTAGEQTLTLRIPKQLYTTASLEALVSNTGSGGLGLCIDMGNDGTCDFTDNSTTSFPATLTASGTDFVDALNAYLVAQGDVAWGADVDVPVRVSVNRQADVLLTNLVLSLQYNQPGGLEAASVDVAADRPLDWTEVVTGNYSQGEEYTFTHTIGPDPVSIHPCQAYNLSGTELKGVGKYCSEFDSGNSYNMFGDGSDGDLVVASGETVYTDNVRSAVSSTANASQKQISLSNVSGFSVGHEILIHQTQGTGAGNYEFAVIASKDENMLTLQESLANTYSVGGDSKAQVIQVKHYQNVTVQSGGVLTVHAWDGNTGGIFVIRAAGEVHVLGTVSLNGKGFQGGSGGYYRDVTNSQGWQGESQLKVGTYSRSANGGGGGGGQGRPEGDQSGFPEVGAGGGGGGYGALGNLGEAAGDPVAEPGQGGNSYGLANLSSKIFMGSGGGGGGAFDGEDGRGGTGGDGGGISYHCGKSYQCTKVQYIAKGSSGTSGTSTARTGGGGGGAGGAIYILG